MLTVTIWFIASVHCKVTMAVLLSKTNRLWAACWVSTVTHRFTSPHASMSYPSLRSDALSRKIMMIWLMSLTLNLRLSLRPMVNISLLS